MEAISLLDHDGPVTIRLFTLHDLVDMDGKPVSPEAVQWRWSVETGRIRARGGRSWGRTLATLHAERAARSMRDEHDAAVRAQLAFDAAQAKEASDAQ